jgi:hypothetical protein
MTQETSINPSPLLDHPFNNSLEPVEIRCWDPNEPPLKEQCLEMCVYYPKEIQEGKKCRSYKLTGTILGLVCTGLMLTALILRNKKINVVYQDVVWAIFGLFLIASMTSHYLAKKEEESLGVTS